MDRIFFGSRRHRRLLFGKYLAFAVLVLATGAFPPRVAAQNNVDSVTLGSDAEFKAEVQQLSKTRLDGAADDRGQQEKALTYLDAVAIKSLESPAGADLDTANRRLGALASHDPPIGENYRLMSVRSQPPAYALVVNFGLGGPAAVRVYAGMAGHYMLAASIDGSSQKDFFDSDIESVAVAPAEGVFVVISGRTDDLATGVFSAWRFDGQRLTELWTSDPLERSSYETVPQGLQITYCGKTDDDHSGQCLEMERDVYRFESAAWKRVENVSLGPEKAP